MIRKGNECPTINNAIFLNKSQGEKSLKSRNERFTLSTANFRTVGFPLALTQTLQVLASSCFPKQIFNFSSKLLTRFEKQPKNSLQMAKPTRNTRKIANTFMTVACGEINSVNLQSERSH